MWLIFKEYLVGNNLAGILSNRICLEMLSYDIIG